MKERIQQAAEGITQYVNEQVLLSQSQAKNIERLINLTINKMVVEAIEEIIQETAAKKFELLKP